MRMGVKKRQLRNFFEFFFQFRRKIAFAFGLFLPKVDNTDSCIQTGALHFRMSGENNSGKENGGGAEEEEEEE